jgi:hypothetical protein
MLAERREVEHRICSYAQWLRPYPTPRLKRLKSIRRASSRLFTLTGMADYWDEANTAEPVRTVLNPPIGVAVRPCGGEAEVGGPFADFSLNGPLGWRER